MFNFFIAGILAFIMLFACSSDNLDEIRVETKGWSVEKLYQEASDQLAGHNWNKAIKLYEVLEATYPYGKYAQQGMLDLAYAYYNSDTPELSIPEIELFMKTYPTNENMDYALYLKGYILSYDENGLSTRFSRQDLSERDPQTLREAYGAFSEVVNRYPNSKYVNDSKDKMNKLVNALSRGEMFRAEHYMSIKAYMAAINRAQLLIKNYPSTIYVENALAMQVVAYREMGQLKLSQETESVLEINFPSSPYIKFPWEYKSLPWYTFWRN